MPRTIPNTARRDLAQLGGAHTLIGIPLQREGDTIGVMVLTRRHVERFTDKHIEILKVFADQAVIAIQNVRLFTELRESLEQQTASAEILQVISQSPTDVQPVLDVVASAARRFCGATDALITLREGNDFSGRRPRRRPQCLARPAPRDHAAQCDQQSHAGWPHLAHSRRHIDRRGRVSRPRR